MGKVIIRKKIANEVNLIPNDKLSEVYEFIHYFRIGLQKGKENINQVDKFAGCWGDMSEKVVNELLEETYQRRKEAFSRRRND